VGDSYIGLISGTSMDGIDAVAVAFEHATPNVLATHQADYPAELEKRLLTAKANPAGFTVDEYGELDTWVGECFRDAALELLTLAGLSAADVAAIGSHGQTVRHRPDAEHRFTLQIGDPSVIATGTGIDTVADFRRADLALGGEAAPLVPPFHRWCFGDAALHRAVLNIGGIANLTLLPAGDGAVTGFDTGPGNSLLDLWTERYLDARFDADGAWAASGKVDETMLSAMLGHPWFQLAPPKSTGFETFNADWIGGFDPDSSKPEDVQATLTALTAKSIAEALQRYAPQTTEIFVCGGGAHNAELMRQLSDRLGKRTLGTTADLGLDPDWVEATAFAWLAKRRLDMQPGSLASVTGAERDAVLGGVYAGRANAN